MIPLALLAAVYPIEIDAPLHNPGKGWVYIDHAVPGQLDAGASAAQCEDGTAFEWYTNAAVLSTWRFVEPEPGVFDWSLMDKAIGAWADLGKTVHLRFSTEDFGGLPGCPRWLFDMGVPFQTRKFGDVELRFPDYRHPVYKERLRSFMAQFARKYAEDPRIETINLQGYGNFGEWHSGYNYPTTEARVEALRGIVDIWREAFRGRKMLNISATYEWRSQNNVGEHILPWGTSIYDEYPPNYRDYRHRSAFDYALAFPDLTISRHGVGGAVKLEYDGRLIANFFQHWRKPLFMEFFGGPRNYRGPSVVGFPATREGDDHVPNAIDEMLSHRATFSSPMGWGSRGGAIDVYNENRDLVIAGHKLMGYRFVVTRAVYPRRLRPGARFALEHSWENRAMGRCHEKYALQAGLLRNGETVWSGLDEDFDPRYMVSGQTYDLRSEFKLPENLAPGAYALAIALVDETGQPRIRLAIEGGHDDLRYALGKVIVEADAPAPPEPDAQPLTLTGDATRWQAEESLPTGATALVSFSYRVTRDPERDLHDADPGYFRFYARAADGAHAGETRWYDKAGLPWARRTTVVAAEEAGPYVLCWGAVGGGALDVRDATMAVLDPKAVRRVGVDDLELLHGATVEQAVRVSAEFDASGVELPHDWRPYARTRPDRVALAPNATYTVWFNAVARPQIWHGDYHYLHVRRPGDSAPPNHPAFRWTQRYVNGPVKRAYTFRTGPEPGARLEWGVKNGGRARLSQVVLVRR